MKSYFTDKERDSIVSLIEKGVPSKEIAEIFGCGESSVWYIGRFAELAKAKDIERLEQFGAKHRPNYQWAVKKYNIKTAQKVETPKAEVNKEETPKEKAETQKVTNDKIIIETLVQLVKTILETNELLKKIPFLETNDLLKKLL